MDLPGVEPACLLASMVCPLASFTSPEKASRNQTPAFMSHLHACAGGQLRARVNFVRGGNCCVRLSLASRCVGAASAAEGSLDYYADCAVDYRPLLLLATSAVRSRRVAVGCLGSTRRTAVLHCRSDCVNGCCAHSPSRRSLRCTSNRSYRCWFRRDSCSSSSRRFRWEHFAR